MMLYLCIRSVGAVCGLHRQVVEGALLSIQGLGNDDGAHGLLYIKHAVAVPTCSTGGRSDRRREVYTLSILQPYSENTHVMMNV